jgi:hypothetical protein
MTQENLNEQSPFQDMSIWLHKRNMIKNLRESGGKWKYLTLSRRTIWSNSLTMNLVLSFEMKLHTVKTENLQEILSYTQMLDII